MKADIDLQEQCRCAIILQQKRALEHELESARDQEAMSEMQLDSAAQYMESKSMEFEEELFQYKQEIARLKSMNRQMLNKLLKQTKMRPSLEKEVKSANAEVDIAQPTLSRVLDTTQIESSIENVKQPVLAKVESESKNTDSALNSYKTTPLQTNTASALVPATENSGSCK